MNMCTYHFIMIMERADKRVPFYKPYLSFHSIVQCIRILEFQTKDYIKYVISTSLHLKVSMKISKPNCRDLLTFNLGFIN